jgi:hypothetical protein
MTRDSSEDEQAPTERRGSRFGCLAWTVGILLVLFLVAAGVAALIDDDGGSRDGRPSSEVNAGPAENYERADVNYLEQQHIFVARFQDGEFVALYDKSPKQQELDSDCRLRYDESAQLGPLEQLPGMRGGFVEECEGTRAVWRADGARAFGAGYGDLDRFQARVNDAGDLVIDTSERTCTRSRGVAGIPPFDVRRCSGNG